MKSFSGSFVALVTPFKDGKVDYVALEKLVDWHVKTGTDAVVPCGTTGESPTLSHEEHRAVIRTVIEAARRRIPVVAGTGSNNTKEAVELTEFAAKNGADAALTVVPYYNKPTQEGIIRHFKQVAASAPGLPLILYNIPGRCGTGMTVDTIVRAKEEIPEVAAVKDATGGTSMAADILARSEITILSGDDTLSVPFMSVGAKGVISVTANILPAEVSDMTHAMLDGGLFKAMELQRKMHAINAALFIETNPIGVKAALHLMGKIGPEIRLPMTPMTEKNLEILKSAMRDLGLIK